jgi:hypothetical protein
MRALLSLCSALLIGTAYSACSPGRVYSVLVSGSNAGTTGVFSQGWWKIWICKIWNVRIKINFKYIYKIQLDGSRVAWVEQTFNKITSWCGTNPSGPGNTVLFCFYKTLMSLSPQTLMYRWLLL